MSSFLGIDLDVWLTIIIIIETLIIIIETLYLIIQGKRKSSNGIEPITADLFKEMLKKIPSAETEKDDFSKLIEQKADEKFENIRKEISEEIDAKFSEISRKSRRTDAQISEIKTSMEGLLEKAITESRHAEKEVVAETLMQRVFVSIFDAMMEMGEYTVSFDKLFSNIWAISERISPIIFFRELIHLRDEGMISLPEEVKSFSDIKSNTPIRLTSKGKATAEFYFGRQQRLDEFFESEH